jgi:hypothetical protein
MISAEPFLRATLRDRPVGPKLSEQVNHFNTLQPAGSCPEVSNGCSRTSMKPILSKAVVMGTDSHLLKSYKTF